MHLYSTGSVLNTAQRNGPAKAEISGAIGIYAHPKLEARPSNPVKFFVLGAAAFYDCFVPELEHSQSGIKNLRETCQLLSTQILSVITCADMHIDEDRPTKHTPEQFLEKTLQALRSKGDHIPEVGWEQATFSAAEKTRERLDRLQRSGQVSFDPIFEQLSQLKTLAVQQTMENDPQTLMKISCDVGGSFLEMIPIVIECVTGTKLPMARTAARHIGAYGQLSDNLLDLERDLRIGTRTHATERFKEGMKIGDIKKETQREMERHWKKAEESLRGHKKGIRLARAIKSLFEFKLLVHATYKLMNKLGQIILPPDGSSTHNREKLIP